MSIFSCFANSLCLLMTLITVLTLANLINIKHHLKGREVLEVSKTYVNGFSMKTMTIWGPNPFPRELNNRKMTDQAIHVLFGCKLGWTLVKA